MSVQMNYHMGNRISQNVECLIQDGIFERRVAEWTERSTCFSYKMRYVLFFNGTFVYNYFAVERSR